MKIEFDSEEITSKEAFLIIKIISEVCELRLDLNKEDSNSYHKIEVKDFDGFDDIGNSQYVAFLSNNIEHEFE